MREHQSLGTLLTLWSNQEFNCPQILLMTFGTGNTAKKVTRKRLRVGGNSTSDTFAFQVCFLSLFSAASLAASSFLGLIGSASLSFLHFLPNFGPSQASSSQELIMHYNFLQWALSGQPDMHQFISAALWYWVKTQGTCWEQLVMVQGNKRQGFVNFYITAECNTNDE